MIGLSMANRAQCGEPGVATTDAPGNVDTGFTNTRLFDLTFISGV
jgi:hypothetical protein